MAASRRNISDWFDDGVVEGRTHMIVVCDTFDHEDYPVYVGKNDDFWSVYGRYKDGQNMQRVMEVYDLKADKADQLDEQRAFRVPPSTARRVGEKS